jgi:hypothetical protein
MEKIDYKKQLKPLYHASAKAVVELVAPPLRCLMVDGRGDPNTAAEYAQAVEALFSVSYKAKFAVKRGPQQVDFAVMPLQGLWWAEDWSAFAAGDRAAWQWTMLIVQPPVVSDAVVADAMDQVRRKKKLPALDKLRLETFAEGRCAQILHVGPFTEEGPTIRKLHEHIQRTGRLAGKHHEIYLSDVRRADPRKWRTIVRQGMG